MFYCSPKTQRFSILPPSPSPPWSTRPTRCPSSFWRRRCFRALFAKHLALTYSSTRRLSSKCEKCPSRWIEMNEKRLFSRRWPGPNHSDLLLCNAGPDEALLCVVWWTVCGRPSFAIPDEYSWQELGVWWVACFVAGIVLNKVILMYCRIRLKCRNKVRNLDVECVWGEREKVSIVSKTNEMLKIEFLKHNRLSSYIFQLVLLCNFWTF